MPVASSSAKLVVKSHKDIHPKNLEATRISRWAQNRLSVLKLKYRAIFEVESSIEYMDLPVEEKAVKAQEVLDEYVDYYKEIGSWEERDTEEDALIITPKDVNYFNYRLLKQGPALRAALTVFTLDKVETLKFRSHIVKMMAAADKALEDGDISVAIRFWKQVNDARKDMEHFLRLGTDNKIKRENVALKKALSRAYEQLTYYEGIYKDSLPKKEESVEGDVVKIVSLKVGQGMQEIEELVDDGGSAGK